ncbi:hypothetical protein SAMN05216511_0040 [Streptomyces sp. KS_16]|nr:hypothetical protein BX261_7210 [Streptomyces sp. 2321.6]SDQ62446.1 hypothetical protein SAMN05216511_0040 [Streptomyces sp. KS_16]SEE18395.1 hypothetical protein SAMN05428940_7235 [Streptomyces sp. 2133.1]SNC74248.1 hypothetical protein SAMN06272741_7135 [Streptomyces sp. 2114.4]
MTLRQSHDLTTMLSDTPSNLNSGVDAGIRITTVEGSDQTKTKESNSPPPRTVLLSPLVGFHPLPEQLLRRPLLLLRLPLLLLLPLHPPPSPPVLQGSDAVKQPYQDSPVPWILRPQGYGFCRDCV